jgi:hypothetical protein
MTFNRVTYSPIPIHWLRPPLRTLPLLITAPLRLTIPHALKQLRRIGF